MRYLTYGGWAMLREPSGCSRPSYQARPIRFQEASSPSDLGAGQQVRCPCMCNALVGLQVAGVNVDGISGRQRPLVLQKADVEVQGLQFQWQEAANA